MLSKFSGNWTPQTVVSGGRVQSDGVYTHMWDQDPGDKWFCQDFHIEDQTTKTIDIQQNLNGDFKIGGLRNRLLIGVDYFRRNVVDKEVGLGNRQERKSPGRRYRLYRPF